MHIRTIQIYGNTNELIAYYTPARRGRWHTASGEQIDHEPELAQLREIAAAGFVSFVDFRCKGYENVYVSVVF